MIVRILTEGQYRIDSDFLDRINELDNRLVDIVARGDAEGYENVFAEMLTLVREKGQPVPASDLATSDVILPASDTSLEDAKHLFVADGLIPG